MTKVAKRMTGKAEAMDLNALFEMKMQALYDIEYVLVDALPAMVKKASDMELKAALTEHHSVTQTHIDRLISIFGMLDLKPKKLKVEGIRGIVDDAKWMLKNVMGATSTDAAIISAAQYAEYYEMAGYATAREWARLLGHDDASSLLSMTMDEEEKASDDLLKLALTKINREALGEEENTEE